MNWPFFPPLPAVSEIECKADTAYIYIFILHIKMNNLGLRKTMKMRMLPERISLFKLRVF
jgi:hypothetical protein